MIYPYKKMVVEKSPDGRDQAPSFLLTLPGRRPGDSDAHDVLTTQELNQLKHHFPFPIIVSFLHLAGSWWILFLLKKNMYKTCDKTLKQARPEEQIQSICKITNYIDLFGPLTNLFEQCMSNRLEKTSKMAGWKGLERRHHNVNTLCWKTHLQMNMQQATGELSICQA